MKIFSVIAAVIKDELEPGAWEQILILNLRQASKKCTGKNIWGIKIYKNSRRIFSPTGYLLSV